MSRDRYEGFESFVHARSQALMRSAYLLVGDHQLAEDLVQHGLTAVAERWPTLRDGQPEAYARRVMVNAATARWRRRRILRESVVEHVPDHSRYDDGARDVEERMALTAALQQLAPRQRAAVVLRFYEDLPEAEVAALLGCSVGTVKSQTHRALARLRGLLPRVPDDLDLNHDNTDEVTA
jgi:RNA polymerase sigma-70 factor (sigma-E family)